jgi:hypothetical protein
VFSIKNPHNVAPRKFALKQKKKQQAIWCRAMRGPNFDDIYVSENCEASNESSTSRFGHTFENDTKLPGATFLTGDQKFQVREIEVFEVID